jgi:hypothetical protein
MKSMRNRPALGLQETLGAVVLSCFIAGGVSAMTGPTVVKNDKAVLISVDRADKGDRLPRAALSPPRRSDSIGMTTRIPRGCDAAFSPIADPALSHIFKRCVV